MCGDQGTEGGRGGSTLQAPDADGWGSEFVFSLLGLVLQARLQAFQEDSDRLVRCACVRPLTELRRCRPSRAILRAAAHVGARVRSLMPRQHNESRARYACIAVGQCSRRLPVRPQLKPCRRRLPQPVSGSHRWEFGRLPAHRILMFSITSIVLKIKSSSYEHHLEKRGKPH